MWCKILSGVAKNYSPKMSVNYFCAEFAADSVVYHFILRSILHIVIAEWDLEILLLSLIRNSKKIEVGMRLPVLNITHAKLAKMCFVWPKKASQGCLQRHGNSSAWLGSCTKLTLCVACIVIMTCCCLMQAASFLCGYK